MAEISCKAAELSSKVGTVQTSMLPRRVVEGIVHWTADPRERQSAKEYARRRPNRKCGGGAN
jgi:hypothetical protein